MCASIPGDCCENSEFSQYGSPGSHNDVDVDADASEGEEGHVDLFAYSYAAYFEQQRNMRSDDAVIEKMTIYLISLLLHAVRLQVSVIKTV